MHTDEELLTMLRSNDFIDVQKAQEMIFEENLDAAIGAAKKKGLTKERGYDLCVDAGTAITHRVRKDHDFVFSGSLKGYFFGVLYKMIDRALAEKIRDRNTFSSEEPDAGTTVEEEAITMKYVMEEHIRAIDDCLSKMAEKCRKLITSRDLFHRVALDKPMSHKELATLLGYSGAASSKAAYSVCKKNLAVCLCKKYPSRC